MLIDDIIDKQSVLIIKIPDTKTHTERIFTVIEESGVPGVNLLNIYRKFLALRPSNAKSRHFFLAYRKGKCVNQVVGINTFSKLPANIAKYLNLPEPNAYTGHSFRRTSASLLAEAGGDILQLKKHGGWKSTAVAEGYVDSSLNTKMACASKIFSANNNVNQPSISQASIIEQNDLNVLNITNNTLQDSMTINEVSSADNALSSSNININNPSNCTFNISIIK